MPSNEVMPSTETVAIQFLKWQPIYEKQRPFQLFFEVPPEQPSTNLVFESKDVVVEDIRGRENEFTLDQNGFEYRTMDGFDDLGEKSEITEGYLPAVEKLLKEMLGEANKVVIFDWRTRESDAQAQNGFIDVKNGLHALQPANFAHSDQGPSSMLQRVRTEFPDSAEEVLRTRRIRILNIWKPLRNKVMDWPLALCDGAHLRAQDLVETDTVRATHVGTNMYAQHSPETQHWKYLKEQGTNEVVVFKQFDSDPDVESGLSLHAAFKHTEIPENCKPRKSIEVRAIVFADAEGGGLQSQ